MQRKKRRTKYRKFCIEKKSSRLFRTAIICLMMHGSVLNEMKDGPFDSVDQLTTLSVEYGAI